MAEIGNAEYQRLLALLKSNPNYKLMLDTISKAEGTWGKDAYSTKFGGKKVDWKNGKSRDSIPFGKRGEKTSAHGKYQFMNATWDGKVAELGLTGFTPEEQDVAALSLAEETGALKHLDNGDLEKAIFSAGKKWMGLPVNAKGDSGAPGQKAQPLSKVLRYMKSNESARAGINKDYESLNNKNSEEYVKALKVLDKRDLFDKKWNVLQKDLKTNKITKKEYEARRIKLTSGKDSDEDLYLKADKAQTVVNEYHKKTKLYYDEIANIQLNKNLKDVQKNALKHNIKSKYYREGLMSVMNVNINRENGLYNEYISKLEKYANRDTENFIDPNTGEINTKSGMVSQKEFDDLQKEGKRFNIDLGNPKYNVAGGDPNNKKALRYLSPSYFKQLIPQVNKLYTPMQVETGLLKYGKTKEEYDAEVGVETPDDGGTESSGGLEADIEGTNPESQAKIAADQAKAQVSADNALLAKGKPFDNTELLTKYGTDNEMFTDTPFKYAPGKQKIPLDAISGLATGLMGIAQGDIEIEKRDERIGEGMLQYAADVAKIKEMGLPPEIEGGLKMKLASAYQTGLNNIVASSNGNRNLVLGNQGQLDQARMKGIVEIAGMDVDRKDKALAAFGEFQQYKSEFDAKRDIANSERKYTEDQKKQVASATLAQTGMASFIDAISYAKENGPGSVNDMRRQKYEFDMTGLLKGAKPGEPGSQEYMDGVVLRNKEAKEKNQGMSDFIKTKNREEQDIISNILTKHPEKDPTQNKEATLEEFKIFYDSVSGDESFKSFYNTQKGISQLQELNSRNEKINAEKSETAVAEPQTVPVVKQTYQEGSDPVLRSIKEEQADGVLPTTGTTAKPVVPKGNIVTTNNLSDLTALQGLTKATVTGETLTPSDIDPVKEAKRVLAENTKKTDGSIEKINEVNRLAAERELIFNQKQEAAQAKLELVTGKK